MQAVRIAVSGIPSSGRQVQAAAQLIPPQLTPSAYQGRLMRQASSTSSDVEDAIHEQFQRNSSGAAAAVAGLPEKQRAKVLEALMDATDSPGSPRYLHALFRDADRNADGVLTTCVA